VNYWSNEELRESGKKLSLLKTWSLKLVEHKSSTRFLWLCHRLKDQLLASTCQSVENKKSLWTMQVMRFVIGATNFHQMGCCVSGFSDDLCVVGTTVNQGCVAGTKIW